MSVRRAGRTAWAGLLLAAGLASGATAAETPIKFSLAFKFEGPSALFVLPLDKGYYKAEGLNVGVDASASSLESIKRVASGDYDMGAADINELIEFHDANPKDAAQGGVHDLQPAAFCGDRAQEPRHQRAEGPRGQENRRAGDGAGFRAMADFRQGQRHRSRQGDDREYRFSGARADAGGRPDRRFHRQCVLVLCRPQGQGRAGQRHRRAADGRLRRRSLRQRDFR